MSGTASWKGLAASRAWKNTSGFWAVPRSTGRFGSRPRCRCSCTSSSSISVARSSSSTGSIVLTSWTGAEAVEEVQERHPGRERGAVGDQRHVLRLLHRCRGQHGHPGLAGRHDVAVVAEDAERVGGHRAGRHVDHGRRELAGDLVQVRDHQQQTLRRREGRGQRTGLERAVERTGGAGLALHLDHLGHDAPEVGDAGLGPGVGELAHRRRRGDRIDGDDLAELVGDPGGGLVAVDGDRGARHASVPPCRLQCLAAVGIAPRWRAS